MTQSFAFTVAVKAGPDGIRSVEAAGSNLFEAEPGAHVYEIEVGILAPFEITVVGKEPRLMCVWRGAPTQENGQ
jgi:hypothetical protein